MSTLVRALESKTFLNHTWTPGEWRCGCGASFEAATIDGDPVCRSCSDARDNREAAEQRLAEMAQWTRDGLPPRFRWASFDAPELAQRVRPPSIIEPAREALDAFNIVLLGDAGVGKTSLGCALLRALASRKKVIGRFVTCLELAEAQRRSRLGTEPEEIRRARDAGVLLLDELGAELTRDASVEEIVRVRHDFELPTIFTSGFERTALAGKYGAGLERRIFEHSTVLRLGGR